MIKPEKNSNALYALQGVLIRARAMAYESTPHQKIADILDQAEMLPRLIASESDETEKFRRYLVEIASKHKCEFILQQFDNPVPDKW